MIVRLRNGQGRSRSWEWSLEELERAGIDLETWRRVGDLIRGSMSSQIRKPWYRMPPREASASVKLNRGSIWLPLQTH